MRGTKINKKCSCGVIHLFIPANARFQKPEDPSDCLAGWFWECGCKSTLFFPLFRLKAA
jgi:hypothetical protein